MLRVFLIAVALIGSVISLDGQTILPAEPGLRSSDVVAGRLKVRLAAGIPRSEHTSVIHSLGLEPLYEVLPYNQSLTANKYKVETQNLQNVLRLEDVLLRTYVVTYAGGEPPEYRIANLATQCSQIVECCSPVYAAHLTGTPNDARVSEQAMLGTIHAFEAWDIEGGSDTVLIGISDSGVLVTHEDLDSAIATNHGEIPNNGTDDDGNGYTDDYRGYNFCTPDDGTPPGDVFNPVEGHGTGVAGICGAVANNTIGVAGVAGKCKMWPIKTMPNTTRSIVYGYESLVYCAVNNIDVVNCSWGSTSRSCVDESIVQYVIARGTAIVAAAGNHRSATPFYPGSYPGVLNVGVTNPKDEVIGMSGHGPTVDIMAPGQETLTTSNNGGYGEFCCTSGSSPIAAAVVALVRSHYPTLTPLQACALVRESADAQPWTYVQEPVNTDLLPYGRLNALHAVTMDPDSLPSIEWDSVVIQPTSGSARWGVGDTLTVTMYGTNLLAEWTLQSLNNIRFTPDTALSVALVGANSVDVSQTLVHGQSVVIGGLRCVVTKATDTTVYLLANVTGKTLAGDQHIRPLSIALVPQPSYTTIHNDVLTVSIGDRCRIGNTDIERGQGAGLVYRNLCAQLYEGGLMVSANQKVVDVVRGSNGVNAHLHPLKRFVAPDSLTALFNDSDAPDSLRLGVVVECKVQIGTKDTASIILDVTVENASDTTLYDLAVGWFCDWDLGSNPGHNNGYTGTGNSLDGVIVQAANDSWPVVWATSLSYSSDATAINIALDNATTYSGFSQATKYSLLHTNASVQNLKNIDVATVTGMHFAQPVPPRQRRSFRQVFVIDNTVSRAQEISKYISQRGLPGDTILPEHPGSIATPFPNPATDIVTVPVYNKNSQPVTVALYSVQGRQMLTQWVNSVGAMQLVTLDVSSVPDGLYLIRVEQGAYSMCTPLVILR